MVGTRSVFKQKNKDVIEVDFLEAHRTYQSNIFRLCMEPKDKLTSRAIIWPDLYRCGQMEDNFFFCYPFDRK